MPLDELIANLPPEVLEKPAPLDYSSSSDQESSTHDEVSLSANSLVECVSSIERRMNLISDIILLSNG